MTKVNLDGKELAVPHYIVCPYAKRGVDDLEHAPSVVERGRGERVYPTYVLSCICNSHPHIEDLQLLPAQ